MLSKLVKKHSEKKMLKNILVPPMEMEAIITCLLFLFYYRNLKTILTFSQETFVSFESHLCPDAPIEVVH